MPPFPYPRLPEPWDTISNFIVTVIFVAMIVGAVLAVFRVDPWVAAVTLITVLAGVAVIIYVFVRLMTFKGKRRR